MSSSTSEYKSSSNAAFKSRGVAAVNNLVQKLLWRNSEAFRQSAPTLRATNSNPSKETLHRSSSSPDAHHTEHKHTLPPSGMTKASRRRLDIGKIYKLHSSRLSFAVHANQDMTRMYIDKYPNRFFFSTTCQTDYLPFCLDFGPVNLATIHEFWQTVKKFWDHQDLQDTELVYYLEEDIHARSNGAFLLAAFLMIELKFTPDEVWLPFSRFDEESFETFRDATFIQPQNYNLTIKACLDGLYRSMQNGFYDPATFDIAEFRYLNDPNLADMNVVCPKFVAFRGPSRRKVEICPGVFLFPPRHYKAVFKEMGVTTIIRLNEADTYKPEQFEREGFKHFDLYFDDCSVPTLATVDKFLSIVEGEDGMVAVHCKAGLGRTGTMIAVYLMKHYGWTASECIGWLRIVRPGSVIGPQQQFLHEAERIYGKATPESSPGPAAATVLPNRVPLHSRSSRCSTQSESSTLQFEQDICFDSSRSPQMEEARQATEAGHAREALKAQAFMGLQVAKAQLRRASNSRQRSELNTLIVAMN